VVFQGVALRGSGTGGLVPFRQVVSLLSLSIFLGLSQGGGCPEGGDHGLPSRLSSSLSPMDIGGRSLEGCRRSSRHHRDSYC
jgi:hypothetical protein